MSQRYLLADPKSSDFWERNVSWWQEHVQGLKELYARNIIHKDAAPPHRQVWWDNHLKGIQQMLRVSEQNLDKAWKDLELC